jgi:hypothetical protein
MPIYPELTASQVDYCVATVKDWEKAHPEACMVGPGAARMDTCCE